MPKSTGEIPEVSTKTLRACTQGSSMCVASQASSIVSTSDSASETVPRTSVVCTRPSARIDSRTPKVGHRGGRPSVRSNSAIGKFDSTPPSTSVETSDSPPSRGPRRVTGSKKNGIDVEARTASATSCSSGSRP